MLGPSERGFGHVSSFLVFYVCIYRLFVAQQRRSAMARQQNGQAGSHQEIHLLPQSQAPSGAHVGWLVGDWTGLDLCYAHVAAACGPAEAHVEVMALQVLGVKVQADRAIMSASLHPIESHCPCQESVLA